MPKILDLIFIGFIYCAIGLTFPIWGLFFLYSKIRYRLKIRNIIRGGASVSWKKIISIWAETDCFYGSLVGPNLETRIENEILEAYLRKYTNNLEEISKSMTSENPYVVAYSFRAFWRFHKINRKNLDFFTISKTILERKDLINVQFGCKRLEVELGEEIKNKIKQIEESNT